SIAITDHADHSNIEVVITATVKVSDVLNKYWDIFVIPGVEITHVPVETIPELVELARRKGAKIVVGHGESPVEPVIPGTNAAAIKAGVDILAHPGHVSEDDARLAAEKGVYFEITSRKGHSETNRHVFDVASKAGARLVLSTDAHSPEDILALDRRDEILKGLTDSEEARAQIIRNSEEIVEKLRK
ncbi:MAG: histidinol phosphate phosphatase domain-containing protein, partial [Candidatus Omnitrophota bacterium]